LKNTVGTNVKRLFAMLFALVLFVLAFTEALDPDMWWHLRTGEVILRDGIPRQDIFSFTVPHHEWVTHEWLSQAVMWVLYRVGGFPALILFFAAIIALTFWLVYLRCGGRPYLAAFVALFAALASSLVWGSRPQIFNLLMLALFVYIVEGCRERGVTMREDERATYRNMLLLPLLTVIWANLHSGYLLGVALMGTYAIGEALQLSFGPRIERGLDWRGVRWLAVMTVASFLASILNANGYKLWIYPFLTLGSDVMQSQISEWQSPDFHDSYTWPFGLFLMAGIASWAVRTRRPSWAELLLFIGTASAALVSIRHIPIFAIVAAPVIARNLLEGLSQTRFYGFVSGERLQATPGRRRALLLLGGAVAALVVLFGRIEFVSVLERTDKLVSERYPVAAVDFLEQEGLAGERGFNSYNWGGYLIWRGIPVFVDGRADVYGDEFLRRYFRTFGGQQNWQEPLDEYEVEYVLVERGGHLAVLLAAAEGWEEAYRDDVAVIFVREQDGEG
jgi:hypothetical protein